jgi:HEAT repeat protein
MRAKPSDEELQDALHRLLDDPAESPSLRYHALVSLKELHHPPPLPLVERYLKSHEPLLKRAALDLIGHFGLTHLIPRVEVELLNFHPGVATEAVYTLVALQAVSSVPRMRLIANHRNRLIREAAIWGINALSPAHGKQPKAIDRQIGN